VPSIFLKYKNIIFNAKLSYFDSLTSASGALVSMTHKKNKKEINVDDFLKY
jgi:hypothetical protein